MKLTRDLTILDCNLPFGVKLVGYALGFTLTVAGFIARVISASISYRPYYDDSSPWAGAWPEPKRQMGDNELS